MKSSTLLFLAGHTSKTKTQNKIMQKNKKTKLDSYTACSIVEGFADFEPTQEQIIEAWQYLHDTRQAYSLQGWYGRTAQALIEQGIIKA